MASRNAYREFLIMEMDPIQELINNQVRRKKERRLTRYPASQVTFVQSFFMLIDCILPGCRGHERYGIIDGLNLPVIFKAHDFNSQPVYVEFKNQICRPLRVPMDGDVLLNGIKWRLATDTPMPFAVQGYFDCLFASLKFQTLLVDYCLECLFRHTNGAGLALERFLKTIVYHIVAFGRYKERDHFQPVTAYMYGMDLKFRRIHWEKKDEMFKHSCIVTRSGVKEEIFYSPPGLIVPEYPIAPSFGFYANPDTTYLRNLGSVSTFHTTLKCKCYDGKVVPKLAYCGVVRASRKSEFLKVSLASWDSAGSEFEDPLLNFSSLGPEGPNAIMAKHCQATPLASICKKCQNLVSVESVHVPDETWLLNCGLPANLQKCSVDHLLNVSSVVIGGVPFELKYVLIYNSLSGNLSSIHHYSGQFFAMSDANGCILKRCVGERVKYKDRVNLRAVFFRRTESDLHMHQCLKDAANRATI